MKYRIIIPAFFGLLASFMLTFAQSPEEAFKYYTTNGILTPRSAGLGLGFYGVSDDISALYYNPAGLTLVGKSELSAGFGFLLGNTKDNGSGYMPKESFTDPYLSNLGVLSTFGSQIGKAAIALSYNLESNFNSYQSYSNPSTSGNNYIADMAKYGTMSDGINPVQYIWLADNKLNTPLINGLQEKIAMEESGGIHDLSGGMAFDLTQNLSIGFSLVGKWGTYNSLRTTRVIDGNNLYQKFESDTAGNYTNIDFRSFRADESIEQSFSGISGSIGLLGKIGDHLRAGLTIKLPTYYEVKDDSYLKVRAEFDNNDMRDTTFYYSSDYEITTPMIIALGLSGNIAGLTVTGGFEYSDATKLSFSNTLSDIKDNNFIIRDQLASRISWGVGAEYAIPGTPLFIRGSYSDMGKIYKTNNIYGIDAENMHQRGISAGIGVLVAKNMRLDAVYTNTSFNQERRLYGTNGSPVYNYSTMLSNIGMQMTYRY